jgi:hypothetical protein
LLRAGSIKKCLKFEGEVVVGEGDSETEWVEAVVEEWMQRRRIKITAI